MIDTDKYKGHRPAPWLYHNPDDGMADRHDSHDWMVGTYDDEGHFHFIADCVGCLCMPDSITLVSDEQYANGRLIADAPLLLEEVKRLQVEVKRLEEEIKTMKEVIE